MHELLNFLLRTCHGHHQDPSIGSIIVVVIRYIALQPVVSCFSSALLRVYLSKSPSHVRAERRVGSVGGDSGGAMLQNNVRRCGNVVLSSAAVCRTCCKLRSLVSFCQNVLPRVET
jgi:hypothetical protein